MFSYEPQKSHNYTIDDIQKLTHNTPIFNDECSREYLYRDVHKYPTITPIAAIVGDQYYVEGVFTIAEHPWKDCGYNLHFFSMHDRYDDTSGEDFLIESIDRVHHSKDNCDTEFMTLTSLSAHKPTIRFYKINSKTAQHQRKNLIYGRQGT